VRFAARLGFEIDPATAEAIAGGAAALSGVSRERIGDELRLMLGHRSRARAGGLLECLGLARPALDWDAMRSDLGPLRCLGSLPSRATFIVGLAAWTADVLERGGGGAEDLARRSEELAASLRAALSLSNDESRRLQHLLAAPHTLTTDWGGMSIARQKRTAASGWFSDALQLLGAWDEAAARRVAARTRELSAQPGGLAPSPWVTGADLLEAGLEPGPDFKARLERAYDAQLEGTAWTKSDAVRVALDGNA
jgi:poly(A) polymerase